MTDRAQSTTSGVSVASTRKVFSVLRGNPTWLLALLLFVVFSFASPHFLTAYNLGNIVAQSALIGFLAVGLTPILVSGNIDLSVGSVLGLTACLVIGLQGQVGLPIAILVVLGAGAGLGLVNGLIVEKIGINSFIVTLAGMIGVRGLAFLYAGDTSLASPDFTLHDIGAYSVGPFSVISLFFLGSVAVFQWVMKRTLHGRNTYAIGGNRTAAVDAGVPVQRHVIINFILCGLMAAVAGIAIASDLGAATPSYGKDYELWAVIAVVLGGTSLRGGKGDLLGTLAAVIALSILRNGLNLVGVSPFFVPVIMGSALILVLLFDRLSSNRSHTAE